MNTKLFKNKKGNFLAILVIMIVIFVFAVTVILSKNISDNFLTEWNNVTNPPEEQLELQAEFTSAYATYDFAMVFLVVALIIGLMITSFLIPTHPVFMVINIIGIFILVGFGMIMTNAYADIISADEGLTETALEFPKANFVMQYLPYFGAFAVFIVSIIMYARGTQLNLGNGGNY